MRLNTLWRLGALVTLVVYALVILLVTRFVLHNLAFSLLLGLTDRKSVV